MAPLVRLAVFPLVTLVLAMPARANWMCEFWRHVVRETKRRQCWPKPFTAPDRRAVREPFAIMVSNGWRSQNMLGDHHFAGSEPTEAGRQKICRILTEAPPHHRIVYVHRTADPQVTADRVENTQRLVDQLVVHGHKPQVVATSVPVPGWPAEEADRVWRKFESSTPEPRIPISSADISTE